MIEEKCRQGLFDITQPASKFHLRVCHNMFTVFIYNVRFAKTNPSAKNECIQGIILICDFYRQKRIKSNIRPRINADLKAKT